MNFPNELQIYFGDNYEINQYITVHHPKLDDVVRLGEQEYYSTLYAFTSIPSDFKPQLWDAGILWEDISDFQFFTMLVKNLTPDKTSFLFGDDIDFSKFQYGKNQNNELILYQLRYDGNLLIIDNGIYLRIAHFLRKIHGIVPNPEYGYTNTVRRLLIEDDRQRMKINKEKEKGSILLPIISSLINSPEFKYGLNEIRQMPMYALMDSIKRVQVIRSTTALLQGCYSGMVDTKKIDKKEFNWMRSLEPDGKHQGLFTIDNTK